MFASFGSNAHHKWTLEQFIYHYCHCDHRLFQNLSGWVLLFNDTRQPREVSSVSHSKHNIRNNAMFHQPNLWLTRRHLKRLRYQIHWSILRCASDLLD